MPDFFNSLVPALTPFKHLKVVKSEHAWLVGSYVHTGSMRHIAAVAFLMGSMVAACASKVPITPASATLQPTIKRSTYNVSWDLEYGYVFDRSGDRFFPEIAEGELPKFEKFFSNANLASIVGKRTYCDCEIALASDGLKRRVQRATLYAR